MLRQWQMWMPCSNVVRSREALLPRYSIRRHTCRGSHPDVRGRAMLRLEQQALLKTAVLDDTTGGRLEWISHTGRKVTTKGERCVAEVSPGASRCVEVRRGCVEVSSRCRRGVAEVSPRCRRGVAGKWKVGGGGGAKKERWSKRRARALPLPAPRARGKQGMDALQR